MSREQAETGDLKALLSRIGSGLDEFLTFDHPDSWRTREDWQARLDMPLPEAGVGVDHVVDELVQVVIPNGSAVVKPGFSSWVTTGSVSAATLASAAASIASPQRYMHSAFNFLEELSLKWLADMCGVGHLEGVYSTGGSVANLIALGGARQSAFEAVGRDPAADGMSGSTVVYACEETHRTIQRACGVLGIGRRSVRLIASDNAGRMRADELERAMAEDRAAGRLPVAVVANAGTTNTGAIDPLRQIGELARDQGIWFHVDGAYGLPGILDDRVAGLYDGLELADSVIVDPHKWLGASVGVAATFVRDRQVLHRAFTQEPADYLEGSIEQAEETPAIEHSIDDFGIPYFEYSVELSSPSRGVVVWAMLREIGVEGMRARIRRHNDMARAVARFAHDHPKLEVLSEPVLSICCFRYLPDTDDDPDRFNQKLHRRLIRENTYMPSTTRVHGRLALRPCYIGARAEPEQVDGLLEAVLRIGADLEAEVLR